MRLAAFYYYGHWPVVKAEEKKCSLQRIAGCQRHFCNAISPSSVKFHTMTPTFYIRQMTEEMKTKARYIYVNSILELLIRCDLWHDETRLHLLVLGEDSWGKME